MGRSRILEAAVKVVKFILKTIGVLSRDYL